MATRDDVDAATVQVEKYLSSLSYKRLQRSAILEAVRQSVSSAKETKEGEEEGQDAAAAAVSDAGRAASTSSTVSLSDDDQVKPLLASQPPVPARLTSRRRAPGGSGDWSNVISSLTLPPPSFECSQGSRDFDSIFGSGGLQA